MVLPWSTILRCGSKNSNLQVVELLVYLETESQIGRLKEFPYCYWYDCELIFNNNENRDKFLEKFLKVKLENGFTTESLKLYAEWTTYDQSLPVSKADFVKMNSDFGDEDKILDLYFAWGRANDASRLIFFTGRKVCEGVVPGWLLPIVLEVSKNWTQDYLDIVGQTWETGSTLQYRVDATSKLPFPKYSNITDQWAVGGISVHEDEWRNELTGIPVSERLTLLNLHEPINDKQCLFVWNDYISGAKAFVVDGLGYQGKDGSSNIATSKGMIRVTPEQRELLPGLILQLDKL